MAASGESRSRAAIGHADRGGVALIRRLEPGDATAYRTLRLEALRTHPEAYCSSFEDESEEPLDFFARRSASILGCFVDGTLVGTAGPIIPPGIEVRHKGLVVGVHPTPAHCGHGLAGELMEIVIQEERTAGLAALRLGVTIGNEPALRLYLALGLSEYGIEADAIRVGDIGYDEAPMVLERQ